MSGPHTSQQLARDALEEHQLIHFYLDQIAHTLESLSPPPDDVAPLRRLAAQIQGLKERVAEHHELEEQGGLFRAILDALPEARVEVSRLVRQHERMVEILEMARIHAERALPADAPSLREDLERFLEVFRAHEREEERLIRDALSRTSSV